MALKLGGDAAAQPYADIQAKSDHFLRQIHQHLAVGTIEPNHGLRLSDSAPRRPPSDRTVRLGVYPVTGNPLHWGHLLAALACIAELELDHVVFLVQGIDLRKPLSSLQTHDHRHALARGVVEVLAPLASYSDLGWGNTLVGEHNFFRLLHLNAGQPLHAHYIVGSDHYRELDDRGQPDTVLRLERNANDPALRLDGLRHRMSLVVVDRGMRGPSVPTTLDVRFVPAVLDASSTAIRRGDFSAMPHSVYAYLERNRDYACMIGSV